MKIKSVKADMTFYVEVEGGKYDDIGYTTYRTDKNGNNWEVLMGESWESVWHDAELRTEFLKFIRKMG